MAGGWAVAWAVVSAAFGAPPEGGTDGAATVAAEDPSAEAQATAEAEGEPEPEAPRTLTEVHVGVHVNDVMALDLATHSYIVDGYLWFRWKGEQVSPADTVEFMNAYELWGHMEELTFEEPEEVAPGEFYQVMRFQGGFSRKLPLDDYPFDRQTLTVTFEDAGDAVENLKYVPDGVTMEPSLQLPGYLIGSPRLAVVDYTHPTTFGDPTQTQAATYSRAEVSIPITRPVLAYSIKLLLPVVCAAVSACLMFFLSAARVDARISIGITSLLTIVALQITSNEDLPEIGYLTLLDKYYVSAYALVIAGLIAVIRSTWLVEADRQAEAHRFDRGAVVVLMASFALLITGLTLGALR